MNLDIRMPIGIYFSVVGVVLVVTGLLHPTVGGAVSSDWNLNFYWGIVMFVFGCSFLFLSLQKK
ncbi:MAG: hypothetical protein V4507_16990 [Verrucomicrobiota bacterium]